MTERTSVTERTSDQIDPVEVAMWKRISWPAVFGGTFVALATELLFAAFGLFIGFTFNSRGAITAWSEGWYFLTAFISLFIGAWVAARLSTNTAGSGRIHGAVTWGLATMATFAFAVWMFWGAVSTSVWAVRTTVATTNGAAATAPAPAAETAANSLQNQAATTLNQANRNTPQILGTLAGDASTLFLVIFGGILSGCVGALVGGSLGGGGPIRTVQIKTGSAEIPSPMHDTPRATAAGALGRDSPVVLLRPGGGSVRVILPRPWFSDVREEQTRDEYRRHSNRHS